MSFFDEPMLAAREDNSLKEIVMNFFNRNIAQKYASTCCSSSEIEEAPMKSKVLITDLLKLQVKEFYSKINVTNSDLYFLETRFCEFVKSVFHRKDFIALQSPFSQHRMSMFLGFSDVEVIKSPRITQLVGMTDSGPFTNALSPNSFVKLADDIYIVRYRNNTVGNGDTIEVIVFFKKDLQQIRDFIIHFAQILTELNRELIDTSLANALDRVFLPESLMKEILDDFDSFMQAEKIYKEELKLPWKRGYMFIGPPGNGKSLLLRCLAKRYGMAKHDLKEAIRRDGTLDINQLVRQENGIESVLFPDKKIPVMCILEDIDKFTTFQSSGEHQDAGELPLHQLLRGIDGVEEVSDVVIVATTNYANSLSEALVNRPGRFDRIWKIDQPKLPEIKRFLNYHKIEITGGFLEKIAKEFEGYSMAHVEELVKSAKKQFHRNNFTLSELHDIIERIHKHNKMYQKHFEEDKKAVGFLRDKE